MKKLFLHIGYPKTGTTGIQEFLLKNAESFSENGILIPKTGLLNGAHYMLNFALSIGWYDGATKIPDANSLKNEFEQEANGSPCDKIIVSSEYFITGKNIEKIKDFFSNFDVKIVVYLRRHDLALESAFAQAEKTAPNPPWDPNIASFSLHALCSDSTPYDYLGTLRRWSRVFGEDAIIVRPFERQQNTPDLYADFLSAIGVEDSLNYIRPNSLNSALNWETLLAIRYARGLGLSKSATDTIIARLIITNKNTNSEKYFSPAMRLTIIEKQLQSYRIIAREFLNRDQQPLFKDELPKINDPWTPPLEPDATQLSRRILCSLDPLLK